MQNKLTTCCRVAAGNFESWQGAEHAKKPKMHAQQVKCVVARPCLPSGDTAFEIVFLFETSETCNSVFPFLSHFTYSYQSGAFFINWIVSTRSRLQVKYSLSLGVKSQKRRCNRYFDLCSHCSRTNHPASCGGTGDQQRCSCGGAGDLQSQGL